MWVILFTCQLSTSHWHASYLISSLHIGLDLFSHIISRVAYHINLPEEYGRIHPTFYVSYLCPHIGPIPPCPPPPLPLDDEATGEFEVEDVLDPRLGHSVTKYLVKWLGYPVFKAMWELAAHLANAPDILL